MQFCAPCSGPRTARRSSLGDLAGNRFASFGLLGKLANVVGDQPYVHLDDEARLKQFTGGDLVTFEQKGKDPIYAVNTAKMIFSANTPPTFSDKSEAVWRRLVLIPFGWRVTVEDRNPECYGPEFWIDELPGILLWALTGLVPVAEQRVVHPVAGMRCRGGPAPTG